jgi:hypothetical protein
MASGFLAGLAGGTVAARLPRRAVMMGCDLTQVWVLLVFALSGKDVRLALLPVLAVSTRAYSRTSQSAVLGRGQGAAMTTTPTTDTDSSADPEPVGPPEPTTGRRKLEAILLGLGVVVVGVVAGFFGARWWSLAVIFLSGPAAGLVWFLFRDRMADRLVDFALGVGASLVATLIASLIVPPLLHHKGPHCPADEPGTVMPTPTANAKLDAPDLIICAANINDGQPITTTYRVSGLIVGKLPGGMVASVLVTFNPLTCFANGDATAHVGAYYQASMEPNKPWSRTTTINADSIRLERVLNYVITTPEDQQKLIRQAVRAEGQDKNSGFDLGTIDAKLLATLRIPAGNTVGPLAPCRY